MGSKSNWPAYAALFAVFIFWGTTYLAIRMALEAVPPGLLVGARFAASGGILLVACKLYGAKFPRGRELWLTAGYGVVTLAGGNGIVVYTEQFVPSGITALLLTTAPFWLVGFDALRDAGERISRATLLGIVVGFLGIVVLVGPSAVGAGIGAGLVKGFLLLQLAVFCWSFGSMLQKNMHTGAHPIVSGAIQQFATGIVILPFVPLLNEHPVHWESRGIWAVGYLVMFGSIVGYSAYIYAMEHLPTAIVSTYAYVNPVVAVLLGWLIYGESFGLREAAAMVLVISGVLIVKYYGYSTVKVRKAAA